MHPTLAKLLGRIVHSASGCWEFPSNNGNGYGRLRHCGRMLYAHRVSYELHVGPVPEGMQIDHLCRNRRCVNPEHLDAVSQAENLQRAAASITACPAGHAYDQKNTTFKDTETGRHRRCAECHRAQERSRRRRLKEKSRGEETL